MSLTPEEIREQLKATEEEKADMVVRVKKVYQPFIDLIKKSSMVAGMEIVLPCLYGPNPSSDEVQKPVMSAFIYFDVDGSKIDDSPDGVPTDFLQGEDAWNWFVQFHQMAPSWAIFGIEQTVLGNPNSIKGYLKFRLPDHNIVEGMEATLEINNFTATEYTDTKTLFYDSESGVEFKRPVDQAVWQDAEKLFFETTKFLQDVILFRDVQCVASHDKVYKDELEGEE